MIRRVFLTLSIWLIGITGTVQAHGLEPLRASPPAGSRLENSPAEVRLEFSEEIAVQGSWLRVVDAQGLQVDMGGGGVDLDDPNRSQLVVKLPQLPQGVYKVTWQVALLDGDISSGQYWFGIGDVSVPTSAEETIPPAGGISPLVWVVLAVGVLLIGIVVGIWFAARRKQA